MTKISDTQAIILSAAAQRPEHIALPLPESLCGGAAAKVVGAMLAKGFLEELEADMRRGEPVWREIGDGHGVTLVATDAGLAAIGIEPNSSAAPEPAPNPPFGVDWKKQQKEIVRRHEKAPQNSPWSAGLPRVNDGSLLFLQHMISKFEDVDPKSQKYGSRAAIVFSGSPLSTGGAGGGESNIRKWIIERDMLEAIVALPEQMFYNTGIGTYIWGVTNNKPGHRKGTIQLVDARDIWMAMGRSQGDKRRKIGAGKAPEGDDRPDEPDQIAEIVRLYGGYAQNAKSKIFDNADFGYTRVTVERPLRLRYRMTVEDKARFLDAVPHLSFGSSTTDVAMRIGRQQVPCHLWLSANSSLMQFDRSRSKGQTELSPETVRYRRIIEWKHTIATLNQ